MTTKVCLLELRECMYKVGISPLFVFFFSCEGVCERNLVCCSKCSGQFLWQAPVCVCHKPDVLATCLGGEAACFSISLLFVGLPRFAPRRPQCEWHEGAAFEAEAPTTAVSTAPLSALVYWQQQLKVWAKKCCRTQGCRFNSWLLRTLVRWRVFEKQNSCWDFGARWRSIWSELIRSPFQRCIST